MCDILVSIVIPVYNVEKYVTYSVKDACNQTYSNIEIIIVDDGSTDSSGRICDEIAWNDNRICIYHTENRGLSSARNLGIDKARGEYIYFLDSDDRIHPATIETLLNVCQKCDCEIIQAGTWAFTDDKNVPRSLCENRVDVYDKREICQGMMNGKIPAATVIQNKLYLKKLFDEIRFPDSRIHEDVATSYRLYWQCKRIGIINQELFYYRSQREGSIMHVPYNLSRLDAITALRERVDFFQNIEECELEGLALVTLLDGLLFAINELETSKMVGCEQIITELKKDLYINYKKMLCNRYVKIRSKLRIWISIYVHGIFY